jgi:type IV pilus assembly protein PilM
MTAPKIIHKLMADPPPRFAFEISEAGLAVARAGKTPQIGFQPIEPDVIAVSPVKDNVLRMDAFQATVAALAPRGEKKRQRAVLILPDFSVRVTVLDFDAFPAEPEEQRSLVRFRIKKSVPFDLESAGISYYAQPLDHGKRWDVVVAVAPLEILARYEAPFRTAGFHPGVVTTSTLCALELVKDATVSVLAKLSGGTLTLAVLDRGSLKLLRTIEVAGGAAAEIAAHLHPTFAYVEDQLGARPQKVLVCGLGPVLAEELRGELDSAVEIEPLRSQFGAPEQTNAGLLGYLESTQELVS